MIDALQISESGLRATQKWIDHISSNVANMQTVGYKRTQIHFSSLTAASGEASASAALQGLDAGGVRIQNVSADFVEGPRKLTGRPLDLAIAGDGFLEVILADGRTAFTRMGRLQLNTDRRLSLVTGEVLADDLRIAPDMTEIEVREDGTVRGKIGAEGELVELGQLHLSSFANAEQLESLGSALFAATEKSGEPIVGEAGREGHGRFLQGQLEMANVDLVDEMSSLVMAQRAYQLNARIIQTVDQVMETINNLRR